MFTKVFPRSGIPCILALCLASCTIGFDRDWKEAAASADTRNRNDLSGAWKGRWSNNSDAHHGALWAIATPVSSNESEPTRYVFRYKATWGRVLSGVFTTEHDAKRKGSTDTYVLSGGKDLGILGGAIRFTGSATPSEFRANYDSKANVGVFELKRPE